MATKKTPPIDLDEMIGGTGNDGELEQAIDNLRGVLKTDAAGELPDIESDFPDTGTDLAQFGAADTFGSEFGAAAALGGSEFGTSDFGGSAFGDNEVSSREPGSALSANMDLIMDIPIDVQIVLGTSRMQVSGLMNLTEGAIIGLDKKIGEPVEIVVNGRRIARGEITVLENDDTRFGVKLIEVTATRKA
ncbi:flagellar motor switch protein FliN [Rhizobiaceae bacterium n13]|uniref:Flagellar motor switch protein FliN n=1 Tax=Ferirhizobium litorale TaxID=2927786 RepID=A0AAE3U3U7_9HYPH|nr:flagellar motor switch protein FliN [Fererhizobium litorale]MDI7863389.1 flagellar motor switch protein FliN [Fererhizobium litorale]MDI7922334.1 flagellar motor switch protein FliN [Fererhizobium litorale]